ncbi:MAG TPA: hypothetical protein VFE90_09615 [Myxococcales bacterium]|nr:hypothetical protein [Myxococcales bacterium]
MRLRSFFAAVVLLSWAAAGEVHKDDPAARLRAMRDWSGGSAAGRVRVLQEAARERDRYAIGAPRTASGVLPFARVAGSSFVNIGPASADFSVNGDRSEGLVDSGRVRQIVPHPTDPDVLFLSTAGGGVWKTWNARSPEIAWEPLTDAMGTTSIGTLAMDPENPDVLYLGFGDPFEVRQPGMVRSLDGGGTWSAPAVLTATYDAAGAQKTLTVDSVSDIKVDPANSLVVLAATDVGLFRSTDAGTTWTHVPLASATAGFFWMWSLACVGDSTWLLSGQEGDITAPGDPASGGPLALWRSTDDGATWSYISSALPGGEATAAAAGRGTLAIAPSTLADPRSARIYLLAADSGGDAQLDVFRSDDAGLTFQALAVNSTRVPRNPNPDQKTLDVLHGQAWYNQALLVDPANPDAVFVGGDLAMVRSLDGGRSWDVLSDWLPLSSGNHQIDRPYVHADFHALAAGPDGSLYAGSDGGLFMSGNALSAPAASVTFDSARNQGLVSHLVYNVVCAPESWPADLQGFVAGGMQDNGTRLRAADGTTFNQIVGGDGIGLAVSAGTHSEPAAGGNVPDVMLTSAEFSIQRSTDGVNFDDFTTGFLGDLPFLVKLARDAAAGELFLTFTGTPAAFYRWAKGDPAWQKILGKVHWQDSNRDTNGFVTVDGKSAIALRNLATHPARAGVWAAVSNRYAFVTVNAGANWVVSLQPNTIGAPGGAFQLSSIELDVRDTSGRTFWVTSLADRVINDANDLFPLPDGFGHVFHTGDGGLTWTAVGVAAGGLPNVGADVVRQDPGDPATLYVGTELGLYRSTDSGATWSRFGGGSLPLVEVRDICIAPASRRLTVATYGRGFWQIDTGAASPAGVRGRGDTNFDDRIDGEDLIDLADSFSSTQASPSYRWQADLTGATNVIDQADLDALLAKFGDRP